MNDGAKNQKLNDHFCLLFIIVLCESESYLHREGDEVWKQAQLLVKTFQYLEILERLDAVERRANRRGLGSR